MRKQQKIINIELIIMLTVNYILSELAYDEFKIEKYYHQAALWNLPAVLTIIMLLLVLIVTVIVCRISMNFSKFLYPFTCGLSSLPIIVLLLANSLRHFIVWYFEPFMNRLAIFDAIYVGCMLAIIAFSLLTGLFDLYVFILAPQLPDDDDLGVNIEIIDDKKSEIN